MTLFGGPSLLLESKELPLSPYQRAALGLICGHGPGGVSRSRLVWLLWEDQDSQRARHRLSQLLYGITRRVGSHELFILQRDQVTRNAETMGCDLEEFESLLQDGRVKEAAALLERGFLSRLVSPTTKEYDDWKSARQLALRTRLRESAAATWSEAEGSADWRRARDAAEALLAVDPDSEVYVRCVIKARALCGSPEEAEAAYRAWVERRGRTEQPSAGSAKSLIHDLANLTRVTDSPSPVSSPDPPLVGRKEEMRKLLNALRHAPPNAVTPVIVTGEAGIGKTRLLNEVCRVAAADGITVFRARCSPLEQQIPLNAFADALRGEIVSTAVDRLEEPWRNVIQNILPEPKLTGPLAPYIDPAAVSRRLFEAIRRLLTELSQEMLVLWIDDFQWADHTTATALDFSMRRWEGGRLVLLLSARTGADQGTESAHSLIQSCRSKTEELELGQLEIDDTVSLATAVLGRALSPSQSAQFVALTDNIPLYIVEVAHELSEGRLTLSNREVGESFLPLPIQQIIDERLALLKPNERRIFELIVVAGELPLSVIEEIIEEGQSIVLDGLDRLMSLRLICESEGSIHCKHELIRQGVYGRMGRVKRVAFHKRVAEALAGSTAEKDLSQIALHFHQAQVQGQAFAFASAAASQAEETGAYHEAIRFLQVARRNTENRTDAVQLLAREASLRYREAEFDHALPLIAMAEQGFRELGDVQAAITWGRSTFARDQRGRPI